MIPPEHKEAHEVQLIGWGENMKGPWVKFRVHPETYEWFKQWNPEGKNQQRFMFGAAPIGNDEQPIEEPKPAKERNPFHELPRAQQAGILCRDDRFLGWLDSRYSQRYRECGHSGPPTVRALCGVTSRSDLNNGDAAARWDQLVARYNEETQLPEQR